MAVPAEFQADVESILARRHDFGADLWATPDGGLVKGVLYGAAEFLQVEGYRHVVRWADQIAARPAVKRGRMVNRTWGDPADQLPERHDAGDFDKAPAPPQGQP